MISAIIHLGNRDWASLIDDFVSLRFLPPDCNRGQIIPVRRSMFNTLATAESPTRMAARSAGQWQRSVVADIMAPLFARSWRQCSRRTSVEAALARSTSRYVSL